MTLIFDIETSTPTGTPDVTKDIFRFMGAYDVEDDKYYFLEDKKKVKELLKKHKVLIGYNSKGYDEPIMKRCGVWVGYNIHLDLMEIIKKRQGLLKCTNQSKSLANMANFFGLEVSKGTLNYDLLNKPELTQEEYEQIKEYTLRDIKVTKEMAEYLYKFFEPFKEYMNDDDIRNFRWLTTSVGAYSYKVICNLTGIKEEYEDNLDNKWFEGGFVSTPTKQEEHGDVYCLDFNSLYPHCFAMANLYSHSCRCCMDEEKWSGNELFPVVGKYCSKKRGKIESLLMDLYKQRLEFKKNNDRREYVIKIIINTMYGISGSETFKGLYNYNTAADCTLMARQCTKFARKMFDKAGYQVIYSDTDSVYLKDPYSDKDRLLLVKDGIVKRIKSSLPFPQDTFDMGIDDEINHIWFFKKNDKFLKKTYIYVTRRGKVVVKGHPMIKGDSSKLGYSVFNKYMKEQVKNGNIQFDYNDVKQWAEEEINNNIKVLTRTFNVKSLDFYKSSSQLQYQISKKYGTGKHELIMNNKFGVGIGKKYCTVKEFKENNLTPKNVILTKFWSEMSTFCVIPEFKKVRAVREKTSIIKKISNKTQMMLSKWTNIKEKETDDGIQNSC